MRVKFAKYLMVLLAFATTSCVESSPEHKTASEEIKNQSLQLSEQGQRIWKDIFISDTIVRPPFIPARQDLALQDEIKALRNKPKALNYARLCQLSSQRQEKLLQDWDAFKATSPDKTLYFRTLSYAFGEIELQPLLKDLQTAPVTTRYCLAHLLIKECQFTEGYNLLSTLLKDDPKTSNLPEKAFWQITEVLNNLYRNDNIMPLPADLSDKLDEYKDHNELVEDGEIIITEEDEEEIEYYQGDYVGHVEAEFFPEDQYGSRPRKVQDFNLLIEPTTLSRSLTNPDSAGFQMCSTELYDVDPEDIGTNKPKWNTGEVKLEISSIYHGKIQIALFPVKNETQLATLTGAELSKIKAIRSKEISLGELKDNNSKTKTDLVSFTFSNVPEGLYVAVAKARYAPALAIQRIAVTHTVLHIHAGPKKAIIMAVDRHTNQPRPGLEIEWGLATKNNFRFENAHYKKNTLITNEFGVVEVNHNDLHYDLVVARWKKFPLMTRSKIWIPKVGGVYDRFSIWTDAPSYLPKQTLSFRGVYRKFHGFEPSSGRYLMNQERELSILDPNRQIIHTQKVLLTQTGSFYGTFQLPAQSLPGEYSVVMNKEYRRAKCLFKCKKHSTKSSEVSKKVPAKTYVRKINPKPLGLYPEKSVINSGETITFKLNNPYDGTNSFALFAANHYLRWHKVVRVSKGTHTYQIKTEKDWGSTVNLVLRHLGDNYGYPHYTRVELIQQEAKLQLKRTSTKLTYAVGESVELTLQCLDSKGQPLKDAEVSIAVVNDLFFAEGADPLKSLYSTFVFKRIADQTSMGYDSDSPLFLPFKIWRGETEMWGEIRKDIGVGSFANCLKWTFQGGGRRIDQPAASGSVVQMTTMKDEDRLLWQPLLKTDKDGKVSTKFQLPKAGKWRITVRAVTADLKIGEQTFLIESK